MSARSTTTRDRNRRTIARGQPPCGICGEPIDYTLPYLHPQEFTIDHVVPLDAGGPDTIDNLQAAHRKCNRDKWHHTTTPEPAARTWVTDRAW